MRFLAHHDMESGVESIETLLSSDFEQNIFNAFWKRQEVIALVLLCSTCLICLCLNHINNLKSSSGKQIRLYRRCRSELRKMMKENHCSPLMLRLAWSDSATFDKNAKYWPQCGGAVGVIRFKSELHHPQNAGLLKAIRLLSPFFDFYGNTISKSDIIQMAGALAVEITGGPVIKMKYGRMDAENFFEDPDAFTCLVSEIYQISEKERKKFSGYKNTSENKEKGGCPFSFGNRLPKATAPYPDGAPVPSVHIRNAFYRMGFDNKEIVALCGAHTIGRAFADRSGTTSRESGYTGATQYTTAISQPRGEGKNGVGMPGGCSWTKNWLTFDNSYFKNEFVDSRRDMFIVEKLQGVSENSGNDKNTAAESEEIKTHEAAMKNPMRKNFNLGDRTPVAQGLKRGLRDPDLLWLPSDNALETDPEFQPIFRKYAVDQDAFFRDYARAHKKMSELGSRFRSFDRLDGGVGIDIDESFGI
jgi:L-ascorbate peroxidase